MMRILRTRGRDTALVIGLFAVALLVGGYIMSNQRLTMPSWVPIVGEPPQFTLKAEMTSAAGILPGQGQAVTISGVKVGEVQSVELQRGVGVVQLKLDEKYANIYPNATVLLRPKTGLKDMVAELDPGTASAGPKLKNGATLTTDSTAPDVNFEEFLSVLDRDTRDYVQLLVGGAGEALGERGGRVLANTFRRFEPLARHGRLANKYVAQRREKLTRVMSNLSKLADELGSRDKQLATFVNANAAVFRRWARQSANMQQTLELFPPALEATNTGLKKIDRLSVTLDDALTDLQPMAAGLGPSLRKVQPFLRETAPVLRDEIRPFTREAQPTVKKLRPAAADLAAATPDLTRFFKVFNALFDEMAYDPPGNGVGQQSYLFYVPWANHNTNSVLASDDGVGPIRRGLVLMSCGALELLESLTLTPRGQTQPRNPTLTTLIQLLNAPKRESVCPTRTAPPAATLSAKPSKPEPKVDAPSAPAVKDAPDPVEPVSAATSTPPTP